MISEIEQKWEAGKQAWLKKLGNLHIAKEATDLEDHREVMAINRERLKTQHKVVNGPNGPTVETEQMQPDLDEMHVGDVVNNHYPQPQRPTSTGLLGNLASPLLAAAVTAGAMWWMNSKTKPDVQPDFVNMPRVSVEAGEWVDVPDEMETNGPSAN